MRISTFIEEVNSSMSKIPMNLIPTAVFVSFKTVCNRLSPIKDKNLEDLDDATNNELKALMQTVTEFSNLPNESMVKECKAIDSYYPYVLDLPSEKSEDVSN